MGLVVYQLSHIAGGLVFEPHRVFYVENVLRGALAQTSFGKFRDGPELGHDCIHQVAIEGSGHATQTLQGDSIFRFRFFEFQDALPWFSNPCSHVVRLKPKASRTARSQPRCGRGSFLASAKAAKVRFSCCNRRSLNSCFIRMSCYTVTQNVTMSCRDRTYYESMSCYDRTNHTIVS